MEEGCYYPRIYLSDPAFSILSSFRKQFTLTSLVLVSLPHRCWIVLKHQLQRNMKTLFFLGCIYFMPVRRCAVEFINFSILVVRWCRVGNTEGLRWIIQADAGQVALNYVASPIIVISPLEYYSPSPITFPIAASET